MRFNHVRLHLARGARVEVTLSRRGANVRLMTDLDFNRYQNGAEYSYYGENVDGTLYNLFAPEAGWWNLVVDLGGAPGSVNASYSIFPPAT
jgi:hypothetical protein